MIPVIRLLERDFWVFLGDATALSGSLDLGAAALTPFLSDRDCGDVAPPMSLPFRARHEFLCV
jgi:hypothetical protein